MLATSSEKLPHGYKKTPFLDNKVRCAYIGCRSCCALTCQESRPMFVLIPLVLLGLLITAFVVALKSRRKVMELEAVTARLRREVDSIQERLTVLDLGPARRAQAGRSHGGGQDRSPGGTGAASRGRAAGADTRACACARACASVGARVCATGRDHFARQAQAAARPLRRASAARAGAAPALRSTRQRPVAASAGELPNTPCLGQRPETACLPRQKPGCSQATWSPSSAC